MKQVSRIHFFVAAVATLAIAAVGLSATGGQPYPGVWGLVMFLTLGVLLEITSSQAKVGGITGSLSFVVDISAPVLFGGFWGSLVVGVATTVSQTLKKREPIRVFFNAAQRVLSVQAGAFVYEGLGGAFPPAFIVAPAQVPFDQVLLQLAAFFGGAIAYFLVNSVAVSSAVSLSTGQSLKQVWRSITLHVVGYDVVASIVCLPVIWLYLTFDGPNGLGRLALLIVFLPIIGARHIYGKLHTLQALYGELDQAHEKLELALREQLEMMVKSIEARDPYTSGHSRRVSALSRAIALDLGLEQSQVQEIETAALLHDVGKIHAEFASLLSKEGRLTQEEWEVMKTHATKSADLVGLFTRFRGTVQNAVRSHHERWDGKGYPDGLESDSIPLGARIIMISDTIDAMTTDRPYRKALSFDKVVAELLKYRMIQFDPHLVDVVVNSVTVRRLVSDVEYLASQTVSDRRHSTVQARPALQSRASFLDALRAGSRSYDAQ